MEESCGSLTAREERDISRGAESATGAAGKEAGTWDSAAEFPDESIFYFIARRGVFTVYTARTEMIYRYFCGWREAKEWDSVV